MKKILILLIIMAMPTVVFAQIEWTQRVVDNNYDGASSVYAIDIDGDGDVDVVALSSNNSSGVADVAWWENDGTENFTKHVIADDFEAYYGSIFAIDLDGENGVDILAAAWNENAIAWWKNDGDGNFTQHIIDDSFTQATSVFAIDVDDDDDIDVLGTSKGRNEIAWWENDGNENFNKHVVSNSFTWAWDVYAIDMDDDDDTDILGAAWTGSGGVPHIIWWENDGSENFTEHVVTNNYMWCEAIFAIDLDKDNNVDILGASSSLPYQRWWKNDGQGNFTEDTIGIFSYANDVYAIDMDSDDDVDVLASASYGSINRISWFENDGEENFTGHSITESFNGICSVYAIDIDNDTDIDVLGAARTADDVTLWKNGLIQSNVGPISIDMPEVFPEYTTLNPIADVANFGTTTESFSVDCIIRPGAYISTRSVFELAPGESANIIFSPFLFESGSYTVTVITKLGDDDPSDDTLEIVVNALNFDVGPISIDIPEMLPIDTTLYPKATVKNFSSDTQSFLVACKIDPGDYSSTRHVSDLPSGVDSQVTFPSSFTFEYDTTYIVTVYTIFEGDQNPGNDTLEKIIETYTGIAEGNTNLPVTFSFGLKSNPVKGKAVFNLALPGNALISLQIYDATGRLVENLVTDSHATGQYVIPWTPKTAGVYFYSFKSPWKNEVGKLVVLR